MFNSIRSKVNQSQEKLRSLLAQYIIFHKDTKQLILTTNLANFNGEDSYCTTPGRITTMAQACAASAILQGIQLGTAILPDDYCY
ncbi:hypothetical protein [Merismopedia glauca]|uniref:Uncharacterized protein n=1 Tax=Merismopedia glauca CCAP 1448/3 TaxID=1296344 RepID=A0A2T1BYC5_9CYAN|nr:hypothetical protein [Merismopedia glauca]PSB01030.1 hypothetical protein C7B64_20495 [Merismopedia glauca CCAP 1448/3]